MCVCTIDARLTAVTDQVTVMTVLQTTVVEYAGYILNKPLASVSHKNITKPCSIHYIRKRI